MIITKLMGGLGNQMFQYAAGKALALRNNTDLALDLSWFEREALDADTPRDFELDCFNFKEKCISQNEYLMNDEDISAINKILKKIGNPKRTQVNIFKEKSHSYNLDFANLKNNIYLEGYWQSEKYFKNYRKELLYAFSFKNNPNELNKKMMEEMASTNSVSIHVRRGDYASNPSTTSFHGLMGLDYYRSAIKIMQDKVYDPHFYIFSDDPEWTRENIKIKSPTTFISHNTKGYEDMRLMTHSKNHIIANSSFSWWGAWLSTHKNRVVISPEAWFQNKSVDTKDIAAEGWLKI